MVADHTAAGQTLKPDEGEQKAWMGWIKKKLNAGKRALVITDLKPLRSASATTMLERGPNAIRSLPEAQIAGQIRRRGKRLQANRLQPIQKGMPPVESRSERLARCQTLHRKQP